MRTSARQSERYKTFNCRSWNSVREKYNYIVSSLWKNIVNWTAKLTSFVGWELNKFLASNSTIQRQDLLKNWRTNCLNIWCKWIDWLNWFGFRFTHYWVLDKNFLSIGECTQPSVSAISFEWLLVLLLLIINSIILIEVFEQSREGKILGYRTVH